MRKHKAELRHKADSFWRRGWRRLWRQRQARGALGILTLLLLLALLAPLISPHPRDQIALSQRHQGLSPQHWLGTDASGRDVLTRLLYGGRVSLLVGLSSAVVAVGLGLVLGLVGGYFGGAIDALLMRMMEVVLSFPYFVLAVALGAVFPASLQSTIVLTSLLGWPSLARMIRAEVRALKERDFITAAEAAGFGHGSIMVQQLLPNLLSPLFVAASTAMARGILGEAALSFLGLGVQLPVPSWGNMLSHAQDLVSFSERWWQWLPPGILVVLTVWAVNLLGEGLRNAFDVRSLLPRGRNE